MTSLRKKLMNLIKSTEEDDDGLETPQETKERWTSIRVVYFTMFMMSLGFSIILTGVWPFLDKLDPTAGKAFMGLVVAANPLGQMLFSPLVGWWANKLGSIRIPMLSTMVVFVISSATYATLETFESNQKYWMLISRFFVGVSSANIAAARSYAAAATRVNERTWAISIITLTQVLGFIAGPAAQSAFTFLGEEGVQISGKLRLNMYTSTGWVNAVFGFINFVLYLPFIFKEHKIAAKEVMKSQGIKNEKETWKAVKPDYIACWTLIYGFFVLVFNFVLVETLATSLTMDQFAWTKTESLSYLGYLMVVGGFVSTAVFLVTGKLTQIFSERKLLVWGGFLLTCIATTLLLPWGSEPPKLALPLNYSIESLRELSKEMNLTDYTFKELVANLTGEGETLTGCPVISQPWCEYTPKLLVSQFLMAYLCAAIGYPLGVTLIQAIFSKLLGSRPQGVWMGLLTGSGCLSRIMGPVFVSLVYSKLGPIWTFMITVLLTIFSMCLILYVNKRFIPPDLGKSGGVPETEMQDLVHNSENGGLKK